MANPLQTGRTLDMNGIIPPEVTSLADKLCGEAVRVLSTVSLEELQQYPDLVGGSPKERADGHYPHLSIPEGWNPRAKTGLRLPNPEYGRRLSPVISFQVSELYRDTEPRGDSRLDKAAEIAHRLGSATVASNEVRTMLADYWQNIRSYEVRTSMNLTPASPLFPRVRSQGFLHTPHLDRSVATLAVAATGPGFVYSTDKGKTYVPQEGQYAFLGRANGFGHPACLHGVRETETDTIHEQSQLPLGIGRMSVVVFLHGDNFLPKI